MTQPVSYHPLRPTDKIRVERSAPPKAGDAHSPPVAANVPVSKLTEIARRLAAEGPPVDHARIAQISQAIAAGTYRVDAAAIADAMLRRLSLSDR